MTTTLVHPYLHVYTRDPALDVANDAFDLMRWQQTGEAACLPCRPDERPARFQLRHLAGRALVRFRDELASYQQRTGNNHVISEEGEILPGAREFLYAVCQLALVGCEAGTTLQGAAGAPLPQIVCLKERGVDLVRESIMDELLQVDSGALVIELGLRAMGARRPSPK